MPPVRDLDGRIAAGADRLGRGEVHELVRRLPTGDDVGVLLGRALDQDFFGSTDAGLMLEQRRTLDHDLKAPEALTVPLPGR